MNLRITTFNVNSIKTCIRNQGKKNVSEFLDSLNSDIICLQETKLRGVDFFADDDSWSSRYEAFCSFSETLKGYSGVATFVRKDVCTPYRADLGLYVPGSEEHAWIMSKLQHAESVQQVERLNKEGRVVITHHDEFILCNIYGPSISSEENMEERMQYKMDFFKALEARLEMMCGASSGNKIIIVGDFNIAPSPLDYPISENSFYRPDRPDRIWIREMLYRQCYVDTFRIFHPEREHANTCWNTKLQARVNNIGSRIDLIIASRSFVNCPDVSIIDADIHPNVLGSDHCPASVTLRKATRWGCSQRLPKESLSIILASKGGKQRKIGSYFQMRTETTRAGPLDEPQPVKKQCRESRVAKSPAQTNAQHFIERKIETNDTPMSEFLMHEYKASEQYFAEIKDRAKSAWAGIQNTYMKAPLCSCQIPAAKKKVTKSSSKQKGKWFYCCSKPAGDQCNFFQWL